jgi:adenosylcobyric acid synthase
MTARTIMVQGTASSVGKSLLVTALCRVWARRGLRVAPFKAQNMALNSAVTPEGAEIGRAQHVQAEAARVRPHADMNPILLKPEGESTSQVIVLGKSIGSMHFGEYHRRKLELRDVIGDALDRLRAAHDLIVIEGAGSPAEVNLKARDVVNMWVAERADAPVVLATDIERGGALAALVGTLALLEPDERARVGALVVNKFRGDPALFSDAIGFLEQRTGVPVAGVIPHLGDPRIASEDSLDVGERASAGGGQPVAVVRLPRLSNFDELEPLTRVPSLSLRWVERPAQLEGAQLVILPGTKCTVADLAWLRTSGLAAALAARAQADGAILGICGGFQMLGERILDPEQVESSEPDVAGLGLLPVVTRFARDKVTDRVRLRLDHGLPLSTAATGLTAAGYEIHCGRVDATRARPFGRIVERGGRPADEPEGAIAGPVAGTLVHGLFEDARVQALLGGDAAPVDPYDRLADHVERALDFRLLDRLAGVV